MNCEDNLILKKPYFLGFVIDILFVTGFVAITIYSHLLPVPLYVIEPMRLIVLMSFLFSKKGNQYFLAMLLPLVSLSVTGHPPFFKTLLIIFELGLNVYILNLMVEKRMGIIISLLGSITISKIIYYFLKYIFYTYFLIEAFQIEKIRIYEQVILVVLISLLMSIVYQIIQKKNNI